MEKLFRFLIIIIAIISTTLLVCKKSGLNHNPVISTISGATSVYVGGNVALACNASDPDGDSLTYTWSCTNGNLSASTGKNVTWYAPGASGSSTVNVTVRDGEGGSDTQSKTIEVNKLTSTIIDWDGAIQAGYYKYWTADIQSNYVIHGSFSVDAHDINFLILDESNYENWRNNRSYNYVVQVSRSAGSSFSATISTTGTYYIILDNTYSLVTDKFAHLLVETTSP